MARIDVNGIQIGYEIIGTGKKSAIITPGGGFPKESDGLRGLAEKVAEGGFRVVIWDRPNCGESDLCFDGPTESIQNADTLAGLLRALNLAPALLIGGSAGGRVSLLAAVRHPGVIERLFLLWITGGGLPTLLLAYHYYHDSWAAATKGGMDAVAALPIWRESIARNPRNRDILMRQDPTAFVKKMDIWATSFIPNKESPVPDILSSELRGLKMPLTVLRSTASDTNHPRETSDAVHALIPGSKLLDPPWGDREWQERLDTALAGGVGVCVNWPLLAPQILQSAGL